MPDSNVRFGKTGREKACFICKTKQKNFYVIKTDCKTKKQTQMDKAHIIKKNKAVGFLLALLLIPTATHAQKAFLKTNQLYGATTTPNLAFEIGLSVKPAWSCMVAITPGNSVIIRN